MERLNDGNPPLSPVLLAGLALSPLPPALLQPILNIVTGAISRRHPGLFDRLAEAENATFLIDSIDLPFCFLLLPSTPPRLEAVARQGQTNAPTATIRGPLLTLVQLLEGKLDGDALFFSRDLVVEGDMEAVVMLRNAVDGAGIEIRDELLSMLGPLAPPASRLAGKAETLFTRMDRDLGTLKRAILAPVTDQCEIQAAELRELREKVTEMRGRRGSRRTRSAETKDK